jgi:hypothetical protein
LSAASIATRFNLLNEALRVMAPRDDRTHLVRLLRRLQWAARRQRKKRLPDVSASDLYAAGIARMKRIGAATYEKRDVQAVQYGDGLMMAMLAAKPVRISTLARTNVGLHLRRVDGRYVWAFAPTETKNNEPIRVEMPESLTVFIDRWLEAYRPVLLKGSRSMPDIAAIGNRSRVSMTSFACAGPSPSAMAGRSLASTRMLQSAAR